MNKNYRNRVNSRLHLNVIHPKILKFKRSQAAMEFLMTYGWAILAAVIAIGVLAYFGIFNSGKYMSESCIISPPFGCEEGAVTSFDFYTRIDLVIRNGLGDNVKIYSRNVTISGCTAGAWPLTRVTIPDGNATKATLYCYPRLPSGKFKGDIKITYRRGAGGVLDNTATGTLVKKVP